MTMFDDFVTVPMVKIVSLVLAGGFAAAIVMFMTKSRTGQAIRATAQDARAARVLGIDTDKVYMHFCLELSNLWYCRSSCFNDLGFAAVLWDRLLFENICYCDCSRSWQSAWCDWDELCTWMGRAVCRNYCGCRVADCCSCVCPDRSSIVASNPNAAAKTGGSVT